MSSKPNRPRIWRSGQGPVSPWAVPNLITIVRILFVPVFVWAMLVDAGEDGGMRWLAFVLFVVGISSDAIDGHLARSRNLISNLGKLLDPIADKALTGAALILLSILGELPWWVTSLMLVRELGITVWRLVEARRRVLPAGRGGKAKTLMQAIAISLALFPLLQLSDAWMHWTNTVVMSLAFALTIWSGADYLLRAYWPKGTKLPAESGNHD